MSPLNLAALATAFDVERALLAVELTIKSGTRCLSCKNSAIYGASRLPRLLSGLS